MQCLMSWVEWAVVRTYGHSETSWDECLILLIVLVVAETEERFLMLANPGLP
jgi:hypothetical protein